MQCYPGFDLSAWESQGSHAEDPRQTRFKTLSSISKQDCQVTVFAVVKFFRKPVRSRGSDMSMFIRLVDSTLYENEASFQCLLFERNEGNLPIINGVGDIVKFTSLGIGVYKNELQGQSNRAFSWITFDGRLNAPVVPRFSPRAPPTFTETDKQIVEELKLWASTVDFLCPDRVRRTLDEITDNDIYFDLLCQVLNVGEWSPVKGYTVLRVWDGTCPAISDLVSEQDDSSAEGAVCASKALGKCVDIQVYRKDTDGQVPVKARDYVKFTNLHLTSKDESVGKKKHCLVLHDRLVFGRGITVLNVEDPDVQHLINRMQALPARRETTNTMQLTSVEELRRSPTDPRQTRFKTLSSISKQDCQVTVFAVVKFFRKPVRSRGSDMSMFIRLVDSTLYENEASFQCLLFERNEENLPIINSVGDIVKFTSLGIGVYKNEAQGKSNRAFSWITFDGRLNAPVVPRFSPRAPPAFTETDKQIVKELKLWASTVDFLCPDRLRHTLDKLMDDDVYFDLLCQVVSVGEFNPVQCCTVLRVWDGTCPAISDVVSEQDDSGAEGAVCASKALGKCVDIQVYRMSTDGQVSVKAGDYVKLTNLHLTRKDESVGKKKYFLVLHDRLVFGRGITVLNVEDPDVQVLINRIQALPTPKETENTMQLTSIEALRRSPTGEFHCRANLFAYRPKQTLDFVKYACSTCGKRFRPGEVADMSDPHVVKTCPDMQCSGSLTPGIYFSLILRDNTGLVDVMVDEKEAGYFFPDINPAALLSDSKVQDMVYERMQYLRSDHVFMNYVIKSHVIEHKGRPITMYRVLKTRFSPIVSQTKVAVEDTERAKKKQMLHQKFLRWREEKT